MLTCLRYNVFRPAFPSQQSRRTSSHLGCFRTNEEPANLDQPGSGKGRLTNRPGAEDVDNDDHRDADGAEKPRGSAHQEDQESAETDRAARRKCEEE